MYVAVVQVLPHFSDIRKVTVILEWYRPPIIREPTPLERANCPEQFTCFVCGEKKRKNDFAGEECEQRLCRICSPWVGRRDVAGLIRFDIRYGFRAYVRGW